MGVESENLNRLIDALSIDDEKTRIELRRTLMAIKEARKLIKTNGFSVENNTFFEVIKTEFDLMMNDRENSRPVITPPSPFKPKPMSII